MFHGRAMHAPTELNLHTRKYKLNYSIFLFLIDIIVIPAMHVVITVPNTI